MSEPKRIYRKDYRPPDYLVESIELRFELDAARTVVDARLSIVRNEGVDEEAPLVLDGEKLDLLRVRLDERVLAPTGYQLGEAVLTIPNVPERFVLETRVANRPAANTALMGLYASNGILCTQCEAEGFRRITFFPDRPDVMARYTVTLVGDPGSYPTMLSNGNRVEEGRLEDGRKWVRWEDPFPKPSYLFALVAGDLACRAGEFRTRSGRDVRLEIWVEHQNAAQSAHALESLRQAMKWDEETFGLEYDLDLYMVVAVSDFNMGAMENKGLNVFNAKYVLASPETATDDDYENIQGVIGHEYFHNWTGNRVTCRDWFQLTLKEGLTVYRDQRFSEDMTSAAVKRIREVDLLRTAQFAEDSGPMAHPIRPESYVEMNNFYTATVYSKGAEVVRLYERLLGRDGFRKGLELYLQRHDGQAVTCDDFRRAMAESNGRRLEQLERWYSQAGTPRLEARGAWDARAHTYALRLRQSYEPPAPGAAPSAPPKPLHVPVEVGLLGADGRDQRVGLEGAEGTRQTHLLELTEEEQTFVFTGVAQRPVPSILRGFSAPVRLAVERGRDELAFLMAHDSDPFNRWDAGQELARELLLHLVKTGERRVDPSFVEAFGKLLLDEGLDGSLKALALSLPSERLLGQELEVVDPDAIHDARRFVVRELARAWRTELEHMVDTSEAHGPYLADTRSIDRRRIKSRALAYLSVLDDPAITARIAQAFERADNMTDRQAALAILCDMPVPERDLALERFHERWRNDPLVLDKWFMVQASSTLTDTLERVQRLSRHSDFTLKNPNRVYALLVTFGKTNQVRFHAKSGAGYRFLADQVLAIDPLNPQVASRLVSSFNPWRRFDAGRQALMKTELERMAGQADLSNDVREIVERALA